MGTKTRTFALVVICALLGAVALAACGGDDESSSSTSATAPSSGSGSADAGTDGADSGGSGDSSGTTGGDSGSGGDSTDGGAAGGAATDDETGLEDGERSKAFVTPGGDNSIQEFGSEGGADERTEALVAIQAVNKASETGQWADVCNKYLAAKNLEQFELIAEKIPKFKGKGCTEILSGLNPGQKGFKDPARPEGGVASIRKDGENAFAIYRGVDGGSYAWPMADEDGVLKVTSLAPTPLQPG